MNPTSMPARPHAPLAPGHPSPRTCTRWPALRCRAGSPRSQRERGYHLSVQGPNTCPILGKRPCPNRTQDQDALSPLERRPSTSAFRRVLGVVVSVWLALLTLPADAAELAVMTFNLRYASQTPPNAWPQRRPVMKACLQQYAPDLIGTQEGLYSQIKDLASDLPDYAWIGTGRDGGSRGEFMAIFYRTDRFEPLAYDHFWLSDTPEVIGSSTWGHSNRRMVTWVRFKDRRTQSEFYYWNTHLDHEVQPAREKAASLIRSRIAKLETQLPILLVGDFNAVAGSNKTYDILVADDFLRDTWKLAGERKNENYNSFTGFDTPRQEGKRIDWILLRGQATVRATEIVTFQQNGQFPSDHFPVLAWLTFP